eukprot:CAMPEP_0178413998 /NCGR_PEP_ID=MMETSP0689_2-20121128/22812_1 /TAXON_ID=160604 /ORGANISM="Amphidinium massartii, Strain CS-259" /LENGTH=167 /DNA_ID=CAMNT_0020035279 /DNA_START=54 /DNA_END=556 /DNA_ORIENTATION=-
MSRFLPSAACLSCEGLAEGQTSLIHFTCNASFKPEPPVQSFLEGLGPGASHGCHLAAVAAKAMQQQLVASAAKSASKSAMMRAASADSDFPPAATCQAWASVSALALSAKATPAEADELVEATAASGKNSRCILGGVRARAPTAARSAPVRRRFFSAVLNVSVELLL